RPTVSLRRVAVESVDRSSRCVVSCTRCLARLQRSLRRRRKVVGDWLQSGLGPDHQYQAENPAFHAIRQVFLRGLKPVPAGRVKFFPQSCLRAADSGLLERHASFSLQPWLRKDFRYSPAEEVYCLYSSGWY